MGCSICARLSRNGLEVVGAQGSEAAYQDEREGDDTSSLRRNRGCLILKQEHTGSIAHLKIQ
jgi:hypothetical protein